MAMNSKTAGILFILALASGCEQHYDLVTIGDSDTPNSDICLEFPSAGACNKTPAVTTPGVVTILFTMKQIPQASATLILANAIKYASPKSQPKILFVDDSNLHGEDTDDGAYVKDTLLRGYDVSYNVILSGGLSPSEVAGKDLVIVHNPGFPLQDQKTRDTLDAFKGGVILLGDDMSQGENFSMEAFTGLHYRTNGSEVNCNGQSYQHDTLRGYFYRVAMSSTFFSGIPEKYKNYQYGNDIDNTDAASNLQVLATAQAAEGTCNIGMIPVVVRRPK
jgi:hypothetical protein